MPLVLINDEDEYQASSVFLHPSSCRLFEELFAVLSKHVLPTPAGIVTQDHS